METSIITLDNWEKAKNAIAVCKTIDEVKDLRDQAEVLRAYAKQANESLEMQNNIAEIKLRAERRIGEFSSEMPTVRKNQHSAIPHDEERQEKGKMDILRDAGIKNHDRYEAIASLPDDVFEEHLAEVKASNAELTTIGVIKKAKQLKREAMIEKQVEDIEAGIDQPVGLFDVVSMDPPWPYGTKFESEGRRVANPYPEMSIEQISELEVPAKENSVLWLWTTHKFLADAQALMDGWGFEYKACMVWNKERMGMGHWLRMQCEFCLVGIKGKPIWRGGSARDIITEARREHSRKPEAFYEMVNEVCVGKKLDFFSREGREGWDNFGNDLNKF